MPRAGKPPRFRGWPRRKLPWTDSTTGKTELKPNLWIGGHNQPDDWLTFQSGRERIACEQRRCVVCGEVMEGAMVFGRFFGHYRKQEGWALTDGPAGHPRCIHLAVNTCPHFKRALEKRQSLRKVWDDSVVGRSSFKRPIVAHVWISEDSPYDGSGTGSMSLNPDNIVSITREELAALAKEAPLGV